MPRRYFPILLALLQVISCSPGGRSLTPAKLARTLQSNDSLEIFNAGVDAFLREDYDDARQLWLRSGDLGHPDAVSNLGYLTYYGLGGRADSAAGVALWHDAAKRGAPEAYRHLAAAILNGNTTIGDSVTAYADCIAAQVVAKRRTESQADDVAKDAAKLATRLRRSLSATDLARGDSMAAVWTQAGPP